MTINVSELQDLFPRREDQRTEGVAFSSSGAFIASATSESDKVLLFRQDDEGRFDPLPHDELDVGGPDRNYPHDVAFSPNDDDGLLAVALRSGSIAIYQRISKAGSYSKDPVFAIEGDESQLSYVDGVAFLPPDGLYLAACCLTEDKVCIFRRTAPLSAAFELRPSCVLRGHSICCPDGLAFSPDGRWLATANNGNRTVSIFEQRGPRETRLFPEEPAFVVEDDSLRNPHSVTFWDHDLVVTSAGANYFTFYPHTGNRCPNGQGMWDVSNAVRVPVNRPEDFMAVNSLNRQEGGPKGVASHGNRLAICSPQVGIRIYSRGEGEAKRSSRG